MKREVFDIYPSMNMDKWLVANGLSLFFIEGKKDVPGSLKERLNFFEDYTNHLRYFDNIPSAYEKLISKKTKNKTISILKRNWEVSSFYSTFDEMLSLNPIENRFFNRHSLISGYKEGQFKFSYCSPRMPILDDKIAFWEDLPQSLITAYNEQNEDTVPNLDLKNHIEKINLNKNVKEIKKNRVSCDVSVLQVKKSTRF